MKVTKLKVQVCKNIYHTASLVVLLIVVFYLFIYNLLHYFLENIEKPVKFSYVIYRPRKYTWDSTWRGYMMGFRREKSSNCIVTSARISGGIISGCPITIGLHQRLALSLSFYTGFIELTKQIQDKIPWCMFFYKQYSFSERN